MSFYDWNRDGKKDLQDDFIEYNIYKNYNKNNNFSRGNGCGTTFISVGIIFSIMINIGSFFS